MLYFTDVSSNIETETVTFKAVEDPGSVRVYEQNFERNLVDESALMKKYINKKVEVIANFGNDVRRVSGTLLSSNGKYIIQTDNEVVILQSISSIDHTLIIDFDGNSVEYAWSEADQLTLAYAVSVHKSQGSEFPAVVMPLLTHHYMMLQRNLLYTAITRARRVCVLVTNPKALGIAVNNNQVAERFTALAWRMRKT